MQSSYSTIYFLLASNCNFNLRPNFWPHCFNSPESKAQVRYDNHHRIFMVSCHCLFTFSKKYISSCDHISCKAHKVGEGCIRFLG